MRILRPPVVAVMGHIDHGKSTLIDYIRKSNITETRPTERLQSFGREEAGGITQHIGAYEVKHTTEDGHEKMIVFLDTPGHEAFGGIRERGASTADIAVLVVSADDGVKPQTLEAIERITASKLPYVVAVTKIDRPGADIERTKQSLAENNVYVEGYGGNVPFAPLSGVTGVGVNDLLELILLLADLEKFEADDEVPGSGVIIESRLDPRRGTTGTGIIKNGVVRRGMIAASAGTTAPLRLILDAENNPREELSASSPIQIIGWDKLPKVGSEFKVFLKKEEALEYASEPVSERSERVELKEGAINLPLIVKADVSGSLEAVLAEISKLSLERIEPQIISSGVGVVSETDVKAALATTGATILAFNTKIDERATALAERSGIPILPFNIIYELIDQVKKLLSEREPRIEVEELSGQAKVLKTFGTTRDKQVIGCRMLEGEFKKNAMVKITRREAEIGKGKIKELQQSKLAVDSVAEGIEFGAMVESKTEIMPGDQLAAFILVTK